MLGSVNTGMGSVPTAGDNEGESGTGGITEVTSNDGSVTVTNPTGPIVDLSVPQNQPLFQLALSYGQGASGNADLVPAESFWFQPQAVNLSPTADQVHEWPTARALANIGLTVYIDEATIVLAEGGEDPRFIITIDGIDTIFQVALTAGAHADETLQVNGDIAILALSRVGVRFDGTGLDTGSALRCEMVLDGAEVGTPTPPPPIPTSGLVLDLNSDDYTVTNAGASSHGDWPDASGNGNDASTAGTLLARVPAIVPGAFNTHPGVKFIRGATDSQGISKVNPTFPTPNGARTVAIVMKGENISPGCLMAVGGFPAASHGTTYQVSRAGLPQLFAITSAGAVQNTDTFFDLNNQRFVVLWDSTGGIGDPIRAWVNGVAATLDAGMGTEDAVFYFEIGFDEGVGGGDSQRLAGQVARVLVWNRVLTASERIGVIGNLTDEYL